MKLTNKFILSACAALALTACVDKDPDFQVFPSADVDFTYNVSGDEYTLDYYVVTPVQFNNISSKSGNVKWDFGDGTTSTEQNPVHKYESAGIYRVSLTIDGVGTKTYPILIYDIVPVLTIDEQSTEIVERDNTTLTFNLELPNPENLRVKYEWTFPEGTTDINGNPITTFVGYAEADGSVDYPEAVKFTNIGSQRITIKSTFDLDGVNRPLEETYLNVQVGLSEPAPTLYYAQRGGNIKALKLVDMASLPAGVKNMPFDMGVSSGNNCMNLCYADVNTLNEDNTTTTQGWIYILDAGKQYYYVNDEDGTLGDGLITAMRTDGTGVNTVLTNVGGAAFNDPFVGTVVNDYLYHSDRNTGVSRVLLTDRAVVQGQNKDHNRDNYVFQNVTVPYYNRGITFGAFNAGLLKDSRGVWWWLKGFNGNAIIRFKDTDIYQTQAEAAKAKPPYPVVFSGFSPRSFTIDETRGKLYVYRFGTPEGFFVYPLPGDADTGDVNKFDASFPMSCKPENTTDFEGLYVTQMALDKTTGRVYFCFRPEANDDSKLPAGIIYYDPDTNKLYHYGDANDQATGICINPNPTKLF